MSILGGAAVAAMQKSIRDNKSLRRERKSLKDINKNYHEKSKIKAPVYNKMSDQEFKEFRQVLKETKKKEMIQRMIVLAVLILAGVAFMIVIL